MTSYSVYFILIKDLEYFLAFQLFNLRQQRKIRIIKANFIDFSVQKAISITRSEKTIIKNLFFMSSKNFNSTNNCLYFDNTKKKYIFDLFVVNIVGNSYTLGVINDNDELRNDSKVILSFIFLLKKKLDSIKELYFLWKFCLFIY